MGIEAATTSALSAASAQSSSASSTQKTNKSDSSFKDEMSKVSESESKNESKASEKESKNLKNEQKSETKDKKITSADKEKENNMAIQNEQINKLQAVFLNGQITMNDANTMLSNDIQQMIDSTATAKSINCTLVFGDGTSTSALKMNESDADFFINLTQNEDVNIQSINVQAQNMLNNGADAVQVKQNVQVSQALLNALSQARENNQPVRIDFDQNISVILRVSPDGAISARFIPGDKAVEQYLRNNLETLKNSFEEQDLPYQELSYSNSSKDQNRRRRQEKQQGE